MATSGSQRRLHGAGRWSASSVSEAARQRAASSLSSIARRLRIIGRSMQHRQVERPDRLRNWGRTPNNKSVVILGSDEFHLTQVDTNTLSFAGIETRVRGNKGALCSYGYSDGNEFLDLVCHLEDDASNRESDHQSDADLTGALIDGTAFRDTDSIFDKLIDLNTTGETLKHLLNSFI